MLLKKIIFSIVFLLCGIASSSFADDTEIYVTEASVRTNDVPQVLIIFDTSGSMETSGTLNSRRDPLEDALFPTRTFYNAANDSVANSTKLYYSDDIETVPTLSSTQFFEHKFNGCQLSIDYLETYGKFTGYLRYYNVDDREWQELPANPDSGNQLDTVDCFEDIREKNQDNALSKSNGNANYPDGFPVDDSDSAYLTPDSESSLDIDAAIESAKQTDFGLGKSFTVYTQEYITWYHSDPDINNEYVRMDVARQVIQDAILATPGVDFGLAIFNRSDGNDNDNEGGRIIQGIREMTNTNKTSLLEKVSLLRGTYRNRTPLCDTLYEAYRYFSGGAIHFGDNAVVPKSLPRPEGEEIDTGDINPTRDTTIESDGNYLSPFEDSSCSSSASIVYITDGVPTGDNYTNDLIATLVGNPVLDLIDNDNAMPKLAGWMYNNDVNTDVSGTQNVRTYTIGFSEDAPEDILTETANLGGGHYYSANSAEALQTALQQVFAEVVSVPATFSSPSVSSARVDSGNSAYYSMFLPNKGPRWAGNIKKLSFNANGDVLDANSNPALSDGGLIKDSACTIWTQNCTSFTGNGDGSNVTNGGAAQHLQSNTDRTLYGNFSLSGELTDFTKANAQSHAGDAEDLASYMGVSEDELDKMFNWAMGQDVFDEDDDNSITDIRQDVLGDSLHSKPLAINYGTAETPNVKLFMGTNHGFMHMFSDAGDSISETWAFMPYELLPNIRELAVNLPTGTHSIYGLDSSPVAYTKRNASGTIETAWLFFGMRRGGTSYYAMDVTNPNSPQMLWHKNANSTDFDNLGQSWSEPVVTYIPGFEEDSDQSESPVIIIGAGYNPSTKDVSGLGSDDTIGRGVFIMSAQTGDVIHSFGPNNSDKMTKMPNIRDSIPNKVAVLDSNSDGITDRIYATDTGANIWRMDLPSADPNDSENPWTAFKFAELAGESLANDRRFFAEPVVAQTIISATHQTDINGELTLSYQNIPYDAVAVGSGHRANPLDKTRSDKFFVLQDRNVVTRSFTGDSGQTIPDALLLDDLYDVTNAAPADQNDNITFATKRGWFYSFTGEGEKSLSAGLIVNGRVFFTSYIPTTTATDDQCNFSGQGKLYGFDLHRGIRSYSQLYYELGEGIPDTPGIIVPANTDTMYLIGIGDIGNNMEKADGNDGCPEGDGKCVASGLQSNRIYYYME
ncbi:pilus assembly protein [Shewanella sp. UCD-KL21]|uniref:pilus assembly protein n=1 Tax=Shewanella sp. UCD-KL21 TaxID=1917164 RepID=UPI0009711479|nr:PilC/PilY family type IV pilus protein [Shewanella sp. UCD-KL21]